jgi:hypothetical protein
MSAHPSYTYDHATLLHSPSCSKARIRPSLFAEANSKAHRPVSAIGESGRDQNPAME